MDATLGGGRYRLQQRIGAGGMASVWLAVDERLSRPVAVKIVADTLSDDDLWVQRFRREAQAAAALSHRGVVPVFDYGVEEGRPYLVMEYVRGGTLAERLASPAARPAGDGSPSAGTAAIDPVQLARELLEALAAVHAAGILHRDVKPANLLIDDHGHARLTDFGIAQAQDSPSLTRTGMVIGSLRYLAPEVAAGHAASVQSDLYSAGIVIRQVAGEPPPPALARLIAALTAEAPGDRPGSAAAALALLKQALADEPTGTAETRSVAASPTAHRPPEAAARPPSAGSRRPRPRRSRAPAPAPRTAETAARPAAAGPAGTSSASDQAGAGPGARRSPRRAPAARLRRIPRAPVYAAAALVLVIVIIVLIASGGGGSSRSPAPSPAPAGASVSRQVRALDRIIDGATTH